MIVSFEPIERKDALMSHIKDKILSEYRKAAQRTWLKYKAII